MNTQATATTLDAHLWNDQTEVVDRLFPDAEAQHPNAQRWYELKDSTRTNVERLKTAGMPVLRFASHAWVGLPGSHRSSAGALALSSL